jgi:hypothetical protein
MLSGLSVLRPESILEHDRKLPHRGGPFNRPFPVDADIADR